MNSQFRRNVAQHSRLTFDYSGYPCVNLNMKLSDLLLFLDAASLTVAHVVQPYSSLEARSGECPGWTYSRQMLTAHNNHRANHSVNALLWNDTLATAASNTAQTGVVGNHDKYVEVLRSFSCLPASKTELSTANTLSYLTVMAKAGVKTCTIGKAAMPTILISREQQVYRGSTTANS